MKKKMLFFIAVSSFYMITSANVKDENLKKSLPNKMSCVLEDLSKAGLGDVKYSILSETQFQAVNGDGWVLLEGQSKTSLGITTEPSVFDYLDVTLNSSITNLPDARGVFFRMKDHGANKNTDGSNHKLGQYQGDQFKSHNHKVFGDDSNLTDSSVAALGRARSIGGTGNLSGHGYRNIFGGSGHQVIENTGGTETRAKNITINAFVKVKQNCLDAVAQAHRDSNQTRIQALEDYIVRNTCDTCINLPEGNLTELQAKSTCNKTEIDQFEAGTNEWSVTCQARTIGEAKRVLMAIGANNRSTAEETFLNHLDNQYPYYNVIETN